MIIRERNMIDSRHLAVLRSLFTRLRDTDILWAVTGSLGFALHGIPTDIHDIDIQSTQDVYRIERLFSEYVIRTVAYKKDTHIRSHFGALMIDGIEVEIMGDIEKRTEEGWEKPPDLNRHKEIVEIDGMDIPVLSLEYEYRAYLMLGRTERAEEIRRFLEGERNGAD
jgi:hypothetical protein